MLTPRATPPVKAARRAARRADRRAARRGMTMLEVVFAVVLLALVTSAAMSTITLVFALSLDDQKTLGAHEIAHKLLLQYLDNKDTMPSESAPLDYAAGRFTFRYKLEETPMEMRTKARETRGGGAEPRTDRFKLVTVRVYDGVDVYGRIQSGDELVVMSRMMDPMAITRNPNAMRGKLSSEAGIRGLLESFMGGAGGAAPTPARDEPRPGRRGPAASSTGAGSATAPPSGSGSGGRGNRRNR